MVIERLVLIKRRKIGVRARWTPSPTKKWLTPKQARQEKCRALSCSYKSGHCLTDRNCGNWHHPFCVFHDKRFNAGQEQIVPSVRTGTDDRPPSVDWTGCGLSRRSVTPQDVHKKNLFTGYSPKADANTSKPTDGTKLILSPQTVRQTKNRLREEILVPKWSTHLCVMLVEESLSVFSLGRLCVDLESSCSWQAGGNRAPTQGKNITTCCTDKLVPLVAVSQLKVT